MQHIFFIDQSQHVVPTFLTTERLLPSSIEHLFMFQITCILFVCIYWLTCCPAKNYVKIEKGTNEKERPYSSAKLYWYFWSINSSTDLWFNAYSLGRRTHWDSTAAQNNVKSVPLVLWKLLVFISDGANFIKCFLLVRSFHHFPKSRRLRCD